MFTLQRRGEAQPAHPVVILKWFEAAVKITAATLTAKDLADRHLARLSVFPV